MLTVPKDNVLAQIGKKRTNKDVKTAIYFHGREFKGQTYKANFDSGFQSEALNIKIYLFTFVQVYSAQTSYLKSFSFYNINKVKGNTVSQDRRH